ncbi:putative disease resistance protein RGA4 isoform X2 [Ziziphus jujuba]|uniref:Disease resistance protein RGA4 isoform X2 n=1 Tax=Ziziphus jujuba TaxID=326968 RepID=A0ABM4A0Q4_ZIZJJ|nr:putative disease resistance protein RGA4 isoform X2 [Ziziphus jujuba]XP_060670310.1 putative disease resistance protein RGA4 isoform X2 [Ziziphus jujuba]
MQISCLAVGLKKVAPTCKEGVLLDVVPSIIQKLGSEAVKEIGKFWDLKKEFEKLEKTMDALVAVILDAEAKRIHNHKIKHWLERLEDAVDDVDNLVDEFQTEALGRQVMTGNEITKKVRVFFSSSNQIAFHVKMSRKLEKIKETLKDIKEDSSLSSSIPLPQETYTEYVNRETHSFVRDEQVIGRDDDKMNIIELLLSFDSQDNNNVSVLPLVGIGGLGKTTLAQLVFNDEMVVKHFELRMWVCISNEFDLKIILEKILKSQGPSLDDLQSSLRKKLNGKKYLLVLDDVWNEDREKWLKLKTLLMDGSQGSTILITTRSEVVARVTQTVCPYYLQGLDKNKSWSLFKRVAFEREQEPCNSNIVRIGEEIVENCKGVPLAIRAIGSILYGNNLESDWVSFKINKLAKLPQHQTDLLPTLQLSYDCLPSHLKQSFSYCRLFPKDHNIDVQKLIKLWMAQGFVKSSNQNECLEDIGYGCFIDLHWRSFFQEVRKDDWGIVKYCKMHDLMHDLAISVAGKQSVMVDKNTENVNFCKKICHVSFDFQSDWMPSKLLMSLFDRKERVRTLLLARQVIDSQRSCDAILSNFECLRALDLEALYIKTLPNSFDKIKHLRYLDLSYNKMKLLPSSITRLYNLQTLILVGCSELLSLPRHLKYLINLRHLLIDGCCKLTHMPRGLGQLTSISTLDVFVMADKNSKSTDAAGWAELSQLYNLRGKLVISNLAHNLHGDAANSEVANLKEKVHLQSLHLQWTDDVNDHDDEMLLGGLQPYSDLKALQVDGYMGVKFATWLSLLTNLVSLKLQFCRNLQELPSLDQSMSHLKELELVSLTSLEYVNLERDYSMASRKLFFPRLERLTINDCPNLKGWWKRNGPTGLTPTTSMIHQNQNEPFFPCLSHLNISGCPNLIFLPLFPNIESSKLCKIGFIPFQQTAVPMKSIFSSCSSPNPFTPIRLPRLQYLELEDLEDIEHTLLSVLSFLNIENYCKLDNLPQEIANLSSLKFLYVGDCPNLTSLPKGIGNLSELNSLYIWRCSNLSSLPQEIANLSSLKELRIERCTKLESLPEGMHSLNSLFKLDISECPCLESLPEGISNVSSLITLSIKACCKLVSLPEGMHGLTSLKDLDIKECPSLEALSEGIANLSSLRSLTLESCDKLALLPQGIGNLSSLKSLALERCDNLATLPQGLHGLTSLDQLNIRECHNLESLSEGIVNLSSLTYLSIEKCHKLAALPQGLHGLTSLTHLYIEECPNLHSLPEGICNLSSLVHLSLERCDKLATLPQELHRRTSLKLHIAKCPLLSQRINDDRIRLCSTCVQVRFWYLSFSMFLALSFNLQLS